MSIPRPEVVDREVREAVHTKAALRERHCVHVAIEHVAVVAVRGELNHVRGEPEVSVSAPTLRRHRPRAEVVTSPNGPRRCQMPLPYIANFVPGFGKPVGHGLLRGGQHAMVRVAPELRGIFPGLEARASRAAHRLAGKGHLELHALGSHLIEVGRDRQLLPIASHRIPTLLVREEKEDVGSVVHRAEPLRLDFARPRLLSSCRPKPPIVPEAQRKRAVPIIKDQRKSPWLTTSRKE